MSVAAAVSDAAIAVRDKLRGRVGQTKVKRYWPGRAPEWADDVDDGRGGVFADDRDDDAEENREAGRLARGAREGADDARLRRLTEIRREREDAVARHREIRAAEIVSEQEEDARKQQAREEEEEEEEDEDARNAEDIDKDDEENAEEEFEAWRLREIARIKREREEREMIAKEKEEREKLASMTEEERREWERKNPKEVSELVAVLQNDNYCLLFQVLIKSFGT